MKIKYYKITDDDIFRWWFSLKEGDCQKQYSPLEIIKDLRTGSKEWYYKGIPLKMVQSKRNRLKAQICEKS